MSLLDIHVLGSPILRQETIPVRANSESLQTLIDDMFETMYASRGIGLAAPQVGRPERVTVVDVGRTPEERKPMVLINPEVLRREGKVRGEEGCLSIPEVYGEIDRSARVIVRALDRNWEPFEVEGTELLARCLQHEIDHLHGRLFIDHLSLLKRRAALTLWEEEKSKYPELIRTVTPLPPPAALEPAAGGGHAGRGGGE
jgi:peptide deformylase